MNGRKRISLQNIFGDHHGSAGADGHHPDQTLNPSRNADNQDLFHHHSIPEPEVRVQSDLESSDENDIINMKPIDISVSIM